MAPKSDRDQVIAMLLGAPSAVGLTRDQVAAWVDDNVQFNTAPGGGGFRLKTNPAPAPKPGGLR